MKVSEIKFIVNNWLINNKFKIIKLGLPEYDDRYNLWKTTLLSNNNFIGEIFVSPIDKKVVENKSTKISLIIERLNCTNDLKIKSKKHKKIYKVSTLKNTIGFGDSFNLLDKLENESIDLVFTSPPYYNAKKEYSEYLDYEDYLLTLRNIIQKCHRVLVEGKFFVINISHVIQKRANRNESSKRLAIPFDLHKIFIEEGYEFIDDIIWVKPEGAGWATGRGRRFAADRNPLQYKTVPVTEYVLVYRKKSDILIDWFIRNHPNKEDVKDSKIVGEYEKTNIWKINSQTKSNHPAPFPIDLSNKIVKYYSFKNDVVLDPFAGSGTVGISCIKNNRRFVLFENQEKYIELIKNTLFNILSKEEITLID